MCAFRTYCRDTTALDYADQRYDSSQFGHSLTLDPHLAGGGAPSRRSWNRYAWPIIWSCEEEIAGAADGIVDQACRRRPISRCCYWSTAAGARTSLSWSRVNCVARRRVRPVRRAGRANP